MTGGIRRVLRQQWSLKLQVLQRGSATAVPEWRFVVPHGGMCLWAELDAPGSSALANAVEAAGGRLAPGPRFGADGTMERFMRLPYALPEADLVEAVRRLAAARADLDRPLARPLRTPAIVA